MAIKNNAKTMVSIEKSEYDALVQCVKVTSEYFEGKAKSFSNPEELIKHLNESN